MVLRQLLGGRNSLSKVLITKLGIIVIGLCLFLTSNIEGRERKEEAVLLVQMTFDQGQWSAKPLKILPCGAPSKPDPLSRQRSTFTLRDVGGKLLFRRLITNPRIILVEDPKEPAKLLSKMDFTLAVPFVTGAASFQFFEREGDYREDHQKIKAAAATAVADLRAVIANYERRGRQERASCQIIAPKPEDPRKLGEVVNTAISVETIASAIAHDQHVMIERGLALKLSPDELRQLVYSYRDNWNQFRINEKQVERFLERYAAAFREAAKKK